MVKTLRLLPEYHCYPVWLYDEDGFVVDTLLPEELRADLELDARFQALQRKFDALFIDDGKEFSYVGFSSDEEKAEFLREWKTAAAELSGKIHGAYEIVDEIDRIIIRL